MDRANKLVRDRRHSDLNYRIKENTRIIRGLLKKSQENPGFRAKRSQSGKDWYAQHADAESRTRLKICLRGWCIRLFDLFEDLPWKTHSPVLFPERQEHTCATCKYKRLYGMRLWWASHEDGRLTCHNCYVKTREQAMPKGYEDVKTLTDLRARKKELEGPSPGNK